MPIYDEYGNPIPQPGEPGSIFGKETVYGHGHPAYAAGYKAGGGGVARGIENLAKTPVTKLVTPPQTTGGTTLNIPNWPQIQLDQVIANNQMQQQYIRMRTNLLEIPEAQARDELGRHSLATQAVFQFAQLGGRMVPYAVLESLFFQIPGMGTLGETTMAKKTPGQAGGVSGKSVEQMFQELKAAGWPPAYEEPRPSDAEITEAYRRTAVGG